MADNRGRNRPRKRRLLPDHRLVFHIDFDSIKVQLAAQCRVGNIYGSQSSAKTIQRSSVVERSAVNRLVVGSNPTAGAKF